MHKIDIQCKKLDKYGSNLHILLYLLPPCLSIHRMARNIRAYLTFYSLDDPIIYLWVNCTIIDGNVSGDSE